MVLPVTPIMLIGPGGECRRHGQTAYQRGEGECYRDLMAGWPESAKLSY